MSRRIEARARGEEWFALKMFGKDFKFSYFVLQGIKLLLNLSFSRSENNNATMIKNCFLLNFKNTLHCRMYSVRDEFDNRPRVIGTRTHALVSTYGQPPKHPS